MDVPHSDSVWEGVKEMEGQSGGAGEHYTLRDYAQLGVFSMVPPIPSFGHAAGDRVRGLETLQGSTKIFYTTIF